jgi:hypothetical protein
MSKFSEDPTRITTIGRDVTTAVFLVMFLRVLSGVSLVSLDAPPYLSKASQNLEIAVTDVCARLPTPIGPDTPVPVPHPVTNSGPRLLGARVPEHDPQPIRRPSEHHKDLGDNQYAYSSG